MQFMRIIIQGPDHAFFNMALDEAISEAVRKKMSPPTLRLYQWDRPSVSLGYFQKIADINTGYCRTKGYPVVRRLTGGRAILHDAELTYSLSSPADSGLFGASLRKTYEVISNALLHGLKLNGIDAEISWKKQQAASHKNPACFKSVAYGEIKADGKKIIGSAQKRYKSGFMQHGSILLSFSADELRNALKEPHTADFEDIGALHDYNQKITLNQLHLSIKDAFERELQIKLVSDNPSRFELDSAKQLEQSKYSTKEWNFMR
jgi:lipoate-protein ligase A